MRTPPQSIGVAGLWPATTSTSSAVARLRTTTAAELEQCKRGSALLAYGTALTETLSMCSPTVLAPTKNAMPASELVKGIVKSTV
jgi:hypothetical protein